MFVYVHTHQTKHTKNLTDMNVKIDHREPY